MKIAYLSEFFPSTEHGELRGGAEARLFYISQQLAGRHDLTILSSHEEGMERQSRFFGGAATVVRCGRTRIFTQAGSLLDRLSFIRAAQKYLRTIQGDILDAQNFVAYYPAWMARRSFRRNVATVHDVWQGRWLQLFGIPGLTGEIYEQYILKRPWDLFIANSEVTKERLLQAAHRHLAVRVVYNGITLEHQPHVVRPPHDAPVIIFVGRLVEYKRVQDIIGALPGILKQFPGARLDIVGVGPYAATLRGLVEKKGLGYAVNFLGHIPHHQTVLDRIAQSTVFCLPSIVEGFGMVTLEAMSLGVPFVNADLAVTREITKGRGGFFFPSGDSQQLAEAVLSLLRNSNLASRLGQDGRARAKNFGWEVIARQTEQCYQELLEQQYG